MQRMARMDIVCGFVVCDVCVCDMPHTTIANGMHSIQQQIFQMQIFF